MVCHLLDVTDDSSAHTSITVSMAKKRRKIEESYRQTAAKADDITQPASGQHQDRVPDATAIEMPGAFAAWSVSCLLNMTTAMTIPLTLPSPPPRTSKREQKKKGETNKAIPCDVMKKRYTDAKIYHCRQS